MEKQELLFAACISGNVEQLKESLKKGFFAKGIDLNQVKDSNKESPLCIAILNNSFNVVKELLKRHVRVDEIDNLPLKYAINKINIPIIELLIQYGANINKEVSYPTSYRPTPLNYALGLDRDYRTNDEIDEVCECLILAGANLYSPNAYGESPVIAVIRHGLLKSLSAMLSRKIDLTKLDGRFKVTPIQFAESLNENNIYKNKIVNILSGKKENTRQETSASDEKQKYSFSVKIASVMGESIYAEFNGEADTAVENRIHEHFKQTAYFDFDEIPAQFKSCNVYFHKKVDIHEAAAIMTAEQKAKPSANTRIDESGGMICYPTDVKNCQTKGEIAWPGGSIKITRILLPSIEEDKFNLVIINS